MTNTPTYYDTESIAGVESLIAEAQTGSLHKKNYAS